MKSNCYATTEKDKLSRSFKPVFLSDTFVLLFSLLTNVRIKETEVPTIRQFIELHLLAQFMNVTGMSSPDSRITCFPEIQVELCITIGLS